MVIVFSDITRAASLWEFNPDAMREATLIHNELVRRWSRSTAGTRSAFLARTATAARALLHGLQGLGTAVDWCEDTQRELLGLDWPEALLEHPDAPRSGAATDDRVVFKGLRVRMGVHVGTPKTVRDPITRRVEYTGPVVNAAARITALAHGGQILFSEAAARQARLSEERPQPRPRSSTIPVVWYALGRYLRCKQSCRPENSYSRVSRMNQETELYEVKVARRLEARFFGGARWTRLATMPSMWSEQSERERRRAMSWRRRWARGWQFKEDNFLTSANLCRWVIDFNEIQLGNRWAWAPTEWSSSGASGRASRWR